ncbi:MAG: immunoglobulin-like domain-containing protein [Eubacteriales bacterium]
MKNRCVVKFILIICAILLSSCSDAVPLPVYNSDGSVSWNGWTLARYIQPYDYHFYNPYGEITASPNVITADEPSLSLVIERVYKNSPDFGTSVGIQVLLDGHWYTIPKDTDEPFVLPPLPKKEKLQTPVEFEVDLSDVISLPPGAYRFVEEATEKPDGKVSTCYARFWVRSRYAQSPPEAATKGKARSEDIVLSVDSSYPAQRAITTADDMFTVVLENLSGKTYKPVFAGEEDNGIVLERLMEDGWQACSYDTANSHGWVQGWSVFGMEVFLFRNNSEATKANALTAGRYRVHLPLKTDEGGLIEPSCEFDVLSAEDAPPPQWNIEELKVSTHGEEERSAEIFITPLQVVLDGKNALLEVEYIVKGSFSYSTFFEMEIYLDGQWYTPPFAGARVFEQPLFLINPKNTGNKEQFDLKFYFGDIPTGKYRVIRDYRNYETGLEEFAAAEFTISG